MRRRCRVFLCLALSVMFIVVLHGGVAADDQPNIEHTLVDFGLSMLLKRRQPHCKVTQIGWIEPTQGVWQDDDFFEDRAGKQLTAVDPRTYKAELKMAQLRDTLLYGIFRPAGQTANDCRKTVAISGMSWYSTTIPVKVRITLTQGAMHRVLFESPMAYTVNLGGSCLPAPIPFAAVLDASEGIPAPPADPFHFSSAGPYSIKAELYDRQNHATGLYTEVHGDVVATAGPVVQFAPVYSARAEVRAGANLTPSSLTSVATMLARHVPRYGPLYFPTEADAMGGIVRAPRDVDAALAHSREVAESKYSGWRAYMVPVAHLIGADTGNADPDVVAAQLSNDFDGMAGVGHMGRLVVLTRGDIPGLLHEGAPAFTFSTKVIYATTSATPLGILHEIVHTEPTYLWSSPGMRDECGYDYHDNAGIFSTRGGVSTQVRGVAGGKVFGIAYGVRSERVMPFEAYSLEYAPGTGSFAWQDHVDNPPTGDESKAFNGEGLPALRQRLDARYELMGSQGGKPDIPDFRWVTQCTYHHLVDDAMQQSQDPHYLLVRMVLAHGKNGWYGGYFEPIYDVEDSAIVAKPGAGDWALTARDASGSELATYGFPITWKSSDQQRVRNAVPFTLRVPYTSAITRIELHSPSGIVASLPISAVPPSVSFDAPPDGSTVPVGQPVTLRWSAGAGTKPLLWSVFYSPDGKNWLDRAFETSRTSMQLFLARNKHVHAIRVVGTDGSRSVERTLHLKT